MYRESDLVELKQQLTDEVKCEIDAFLNTKGGTIYIGVADAGAVMPFADEKSKDEADLKIGSWIREAFFPMPVDLIKHGFNEDGVLFVEIKEGKDKPYYSLLTLPEMVMKPLRFSSSFSSRMTL